MPLVKARYINRIAVHYTLPFQNVFKSSLGWSIKRILKHANVELPFATPLEKKWNDGMIVFMCVKEVWQFHLVIANILWSSQRHRNLTCPFCIPFSISTVMKYPSLSYFTFGHWSQTWKNILREFYKRTLAIMKEHTKKV